MQIVIEISKELYKSIPKDKSDIGYMDMSDWQKIINIVKNGTPLPKTNGEVLMTMFPPSVYYGKDKRLVLLAKDVCLECVNDEWWNAEYEVRQNESGNKTESEDKE